MIVIVIINAQYLTKYAKSAQKENEFYETPYSVPFLFQLYIYVCVCVCVCVFVCMYVFFFLVIDTMEIKSNTQRIWTEPAIAIKLQIWAPIFSFYWNGEFSNAHFMNIIKYQAIYLISMQTLGNRIHMDRLNGFSRLMIVSDLDSTMVDFLLICL